MNFIEYLKLFLYIYSIYNYCVFMVRWLWRGENTRFHSELGRENPQRRWYFVLRHGRVGRCRALKSQFTICFDAGWSSLVARQAHNLKVAGSNPAPATNT